MTKKSKKILIVGPAWVGDMVMAQSLFIYLKQAHPTCIIDVLAPAWSEPLLALMPEVRQSHVMPLGHGKLGLSERIQLGKSLRSEQYDQSITLPNSWKSALVPWATKIKRRIGYKGEMRYGLLNDIHRLDKQILTMTVQRFVALGAEKSIKTNISLKDCPQPRLSIDQEQAKSTLKQHQLETNKPLLALCAGAEYGSAKCWPAEHYADLARYFLEHAWQVVLLGSEKDQIICNKINHLVKQADTGQSLSSPPECVNLAGKTSLQEAIFILSQSDYVVSNDSGLMHIAAAVNRPLIALYGSSDPSFTPPLHQAAQIVYLDLACSPCFKRECPLGHLDCLQNILPKQLITMIETEKPSDDS